MKTAEFEYFVFNEWNDNDPDEPYNVIAFLGEAGEVANEWKKFTRKKLTDAEYEENLLLELGDVLHYMVRIGRLHNFGLKEIMAANVEKLRNRKLYGKGNKGKRS